MLEYYSVKVGIIWSLKRNNFLQFVRLIRYVVFGNVFMADGELTMYLLPSNV